MLIYNHKKEFIGIDKYDVEALGCASFEQILQESADFADLFVKTPGYIHNFKHVHWIDFITCAESNEDAKAIINIKGKNYKTTLSIETFFLKEHPSKKSYLIKLNNLRVLTVQENEKISADILRKPPKQSYVPAPEAIEEEKEEEVESYIPPKIEIATQEEVCTPEIDVITYEEPLSIELDPYDRDYEEISFVTEDDFSQEDEPVTLEPVEKQEQSDFENDFKLDLDGLDDDFVEEIAKPSQAEIKTPTSTKKVEDLIDDDFDNSYVYNPKVASEELGLPIDLIEEFIQDFIAQANEFREPLYTSLDKNDIDNIRILSHKLKGVAANLRIENAFNMLVTINASDDVQQIDLSLNRFYKIIAKLSGKEEIAPQKEIEEILDIAPQEEVLNVEMKEEDIFSLSDEKEPDFSLKEDDDLYADITPDDYIFNTNNISDTKEFDFEEDTFVLKSSEPAHSSHAYNKKMAANEIGLDYESFNELFRNYLQESDRLVKMIESAVMNNDLPMCKKVALNLKGMSDNMRLDNISKELESIVSASDLDVVNSHISTIQELLVSISHTED